MADDGHVVVLLAIDIAQPLGPLDVLEFGRDAHLGQHGGNHLAALARIRRGRQLDGEFQVLDARLLQQQLGLFRIVGVDAGGVDIPEGTRHIVAPDGHAETIGCAVNDALAVDGGRDGAAHAHIVQRLAAVVHGQNGLGARGSHQHLEALVILELIQAARHLHAREQVYIAGQQRRGLGGGVGDETEGRAVDGDLVGCTVLGPFLHRQRCALAPLIQHIGAGADRRGRVAASALGLDDDRRGLAEQKRQVRIGLGALQHHGVCIGRADAAEAGEQALVLVGALFTGRALEGELDSFGVEGLAIVEFGVLAQMEGPGLLVGRFPFFGQQRLHGAIRLDLGQGLVDVVERDLANGGSSASRGIQPRRLQHHAQRQVTFGLLGASRLLAQRTCAHRPGQARQQY